MTERLTYVKHTLMDLVEEQMEHLERVDAKELGEVIDMIKDIEEAMYYCTVTEAMHSKGYSTKWEEDKEHPTESIEDHKWGISHAQRKNYIESKEMHHGKAKQLQELEKYMKDLSADLVEMIEDASTEEKQYLGNRLSTLAAKITKLENA